MEDWNWETIFYEHYRSIFNHCDIIGLKICRIQRKNPKWGLLWRSRSFKVIEVGTNRKPICDFLLVINGNWNPTSYRFGVIATYSLNFGQFAFWSHPLGGLGTMYDVHLGLTGKHIVDFLVLIELFSLGVTAESLRVKRDRKNQHK